MYFSSRDYSLDMYYLITCHTKKQVTNFAPRGISGGASLKTLDITGFSPFVNFVFFINFYYFLLNFWAKSYSNIPQKPLFKKIYL